jgi:hypothetical protein
MNRLGRKITGGVKKLGKKVDGTAHMLGKKADGVVNKAEHLNNAVLKQSGALLNGLDKGLTVGTRILSAANAAGLGAVPGVGQASMALERGGKTALAGVKIRLRKFEKILNRSQNVHLIKLIKELTNWKNLTLGKWPPRLFVMPRPIIRTTPNELLHN